MKRKLVAACCLLLPATILFGLAQAWGPGVEPDLFTPVASAFDRPQCSEIRSRHVAIRPGLIAKDTPALMLNLFAGKRLRATHTSTIIRSEKQFTWFAHLEGIPFGLAALLVDGPVTVGVVLAGDRVYRIAPEGDDAFRIAEFDANDLPALLAPIGKPKSDVYGLGAKGSAKDDGSMIDVMVVYTPQSHFGAGNLAAEAQLAIDLTNWSYGQSGIDQRLRLVHLAEVSDAELPTIRDNLHALRNNDDGIMDEVHAWRDQVGADLVGLWIGNPDDCGVGYHMQIVDVAFEDYAFTATSRICALFFAFAHEMGHNMGAGHDWYVDDAVLPYPYAHGYIFQPGNYCVRTIMAYNDFCTDQGLITIPVPLWANPDDDLFGHALGVPQNEPEPADVRKTFNKTAWTVANFRPTVCDCAVMGVCYDDGTINPENGCQVCNATLSPEAWTNNDGAPCQDDGLFCNGEDVCVDGSCVHSGDPCPEGAMCDETSRSCEPASDDDDDDDDNNEDTGDDDDNKQPEESEEDAHRNSEVEQGRCCGA